MCDNRKDIIFSELSSDENVLLASFENLSDETKIAILSYLKLLAENNKKTNE